MALRVDRTAQRVQVRLLRGVLQRQDVAVDIAILRGQSGGRDLRIAQTCERILVLRDVRRVLGGGEQLGGEGIGEGRFFFVELLQFRLIGIGEVGPGVHKFLVGELDQAQRFRIKLQRIALFINGGDTLKQFGVEIDGVRMRRQPGAS